MSNQHYGSQANNIRPKKLDPNLLVSTVFAIFFNTNTDTSYRGGETNIKNKKDKDSGQYLPAAVVINGQERAVRQLYATDNTRDNGLGNLKVRLPLAQPSTSALAEREVS